MKVLTIIKKHEFYKLKKYKVYGSMLNDYKKRPYKKVFLCVKFCYEF